MRIGILTQKLENNYGGILQNYALQVVLRKMGHTPITIDFRPGDSFFWYLLSQVKILFLILKGNKVNFTSYRQERTYRSPLTESFVKRNIVTTHRIQLLTPIIPILYRFKFVIVGSDQVWRKQYNVLRNTFLAFVKGGVKKMAYAASFGVGEWEMTKQETNTCKQWISTFKGVSTREESGVRLCKDYLNVEAVHVLDPTLLLSSYDYNKLCSEIKSPNTPFIFAYILDLDDSKRRMLQLFAHEMGLDIILYSAEKHLSHSVEEWLAGFRDADFVITDSFHGTVFSIIYRKNFFSFINKGRGEDRFVSLLKMFNLEDRIISNKILSSKEINWNSVDSELETQKKLSTSFIIKTLSK